MKSLCRYASPALILNSSTFSKGNYCCRTFSASPSRSLVFRNLSPVLGHVYLDSKPLRILLANISFPAFQSKPTVVGVVPDYHQVSFKQRWTAHRLFYCDPYEGDLFCSYHGKNLIKVSTRKKKVGESVFPGNPFDYFFLMDYFNAQYKNERKFMSALLQPLPRWRSLSAVGLIGRSCLQCTFAQINRIKKCWVLQRRRLFTYFLRIHYPIALRLSSAVRSCTGTMNAWDRYICYRISIDAGWFCQKLVLAVISLRC